MGKALVSQGNLTRMQVEVEAGEDPHQGGNGDEAVGDTGLERREMEMVSQRAHVHPACVSKETHNAYSLCSPQLRDTHKPRHTCTHTEIHTQTHRHPLSIPVLMSNRKLGKEKRGKERGGRALHPSQPFMQR